MSCAGPVWCECLFVAETEIVWTFLLCYWACGSWGRMEGETGRSPIAVKAGTTAPD